jgi:hypothetical protein
LIELRAQSKADADSIAATWNKDVARQIERLYKQNPKGNRSYYASNLERWANNRAFWKQPSIALNTEQTTRYYAARRFSAENGLQGTKYVFAGSPPVCKRCMRLFALGVVSESVVRKNVTPVHLNCPHEWQPFNPQRIPCNELWLG